MAKKRLITSALPYVNNIPHLGNLIGAVLSADVFARYSRLAGFETLYICGSDEHGTATETKALAEKVSPEELCNKYHEIHKKIYEWFNISFDHYGRTHAHNHTQITQKLFSDLHENGYIVEKEVEQLFDEKAQKFLADRFVTGTCPFCDYESANGDQCESCGKLINANELKNPVSKITGTTPIIKKSNHLFIDLKKMQPELKKWFEKSSNEGKWSDNAIKNTQGWLKEGLKERAISRDLKWGVPIPLESYKEKVFYVWFDAPIGYISITAEHFKEDFSDGEKQWRKWWQSEDVKLYQFMGKDNIPFHSIIFPSILLGAKDKWTKIHHLSSTEYLNYESGKFSKSNNTGVFGEDAKETGIPSDVWRYYLLSNRPENSDTTFTWHEFGDRLNNELVANIGNLVNRTIVFLNKHLDGRTGQITEKFDYSKQVALIEELYEKVELRKALHEIMQLSKLGNQYFQKEEPWANSKEKASNALTNLATLLKDLSILIEPFLPSTAEKIRKQLSINDQNFSNLGDVLENHEIGIGEILFKKVEDKEIEKLKEKFAGKVEIDSRIVDLRVAEIVDAKEHPDADKLMVLKVKADKERQIVAGIRSSYNKEDLVGKKIVIVANLEKAKLRGEVSEGMLLAAGDKEARLLLPEGKAGDIVSTQKRKNEKRPAKINYKQFSSIKLESVKGIAHADGDKLLVNDKEIKVDKEVSGKIK